MAYDGSCDCTTEFTISQCCFDTVFDVTIDDCCDYVFDPNPQNKCRPDCGGGIAVPQVEPCGGNTILPFEILKGQTKTVTLAWEIPCDTESPPPWNYRWQTFYEAGLYRGPPTIAGWCELLGDGYYFVYQAELTCYCEVE